MQFGFNFQTLEVFVPPLYLNVCLYFHWENIAWRNKRRNRKGARGGVCHEKMDVNGDLSHSFVFFAVKANTT